MKLIKKPTKSMRSLVKSHPKKKKFHQDSDDSVSDSRISFQESDCSTNWCDLEDSEKENDMENKSTENEFQENRVDLTKLKENSYVLVEYDGSIYPGTVLRILDDSALISATEKSG